MPDIVTEEFSQNIYTDPQGTKKTNPTIFDELRWAMQHSQKPLEQTLQLISEFHGTWTGMSQQLLQFIQSISQNKSYVQIAQSAMKLFNSLSTNTSNIGRVNNITAGNMSVPLLKEFVSKAQALHPAINNYIQLNIGKYPYFQQISESVCQHGQIVLGKHEVPPVPNLTVNGSTTMTSSNRLRRITENKLFDTIKPLINNVEIFTNIMFLRCMPMSNNMGLLNQNYGATGSSPLAHGHNYTMDGFNASRGKAAISPCVSNATSRFGPTLQLVDTFFPVQYQITNSPKFFNLESEWGNFVADKLLRPITRESEIIIADNAYKTTLI